MTTITVHDSTESHPQLVDQIAQFLSEATPTVAKVTGLAAPSTVAIRLMDTRDMSREYATFTQEHFAQATEGLTLNPYEERILAAMPRTREISIALAWARTPAEIVTDSHGQPTTLINPTALQHAGLIDAPDHLHALLVDRLTQQAQAIASQAQLVPSRWPVLPVTRDPVGQLAKGHRRWTADRVMWHILGRPLAPARLRRSAVYRRHAIFDLLEGPTLPMRIRRAVAFVDQTMATVGQASSVLRSVMPHQSSQT
ncbi:hypothetical protein ACWD4N_46440 [Streptomyces sp. NPDC002586]